MDQTQIAAAGAGFALGLSLIVAIGAQNAFVLRQGLRREHVGAVIAVCAVSDALLISAGVLGFARLAEVAPWFAPAMRWFGAAFLLVYGAMALRSAWRGGATLETGPGAGHSLGRALAVCLTLTWANPHVYLDTVVLMGAVSAEWQARGAFALGGMTASLCFFVALGYGARLLAPLFRRPGAWRGLDLGVGIVMWTIGLRLTLAG